MKESENETNKLRAAELLGKTVGLFKADTVESDKERTPEQIRADLKLIMAEVFDKPEKTQLKAVK